MVFLQYVSDWLELTESSVDDHMQPFILISFEMPYKLQK